MSLENYAYNTKNQVGENKVGKMHGKHSIIDSLVRSKREAILTVTEIKNTLAPKAMKLYCNTE